MTCNGYSRRPEGCDGPFLAALARQFLQFARARSGQRTSASTKSRLRSRHLPKRALDELDLDPQLDASATIEDLLPPPTGGAPKLNGGTDK